MSNEIEPRTPAEQVALLSTAPDARDVTAELAAPPRRKLPWLSLALGGAVIATAAFAGGVWYQQGHGSGGSGKAVAGGQQPRAAASGFGGQNGNRRNGQGGQGAGQGGPGAGGQGAGGQGGFTRGTVKAVDGTTVYLTDANGNTVKVTTGDATKVQLNKEGKVTDLQPGQSVTVMGTPDANGGYNATQLVEGASGFGGGNRNPSGG
ncbi:DUF5666 domain-containing protein [Streptomyces sp. CB01881]|uniref:DUF5666 domain-containing protein n=1 Tax=Streptomyces sp. CB01881 TaxID=2078691 RepID=UPI000CDBF88F|nr:DUF5666 domain-containing protein [Streptomyces sp. CB01881]AUY50662.1 hypothetical protein C2142_18855 [Streptomyces sp. CB01881]TYC74049.1 hypothetical protein EH183_18825 [Streptomyces sp. CB01881]